jgi:hypothetical protein
VVGVELQHSKNSTTKLHDSGLLLELRLVVEHRTQKGEDHRPLNEIETEEAVTKNEEW